MLTNYIRIALRNLFRNKLHTFINTGGLIIGFTIGISVLLVVYGQYSYDNFHVNGKRIYQAYQVFNKAEGEEIENQFGFGAAPAYKAEASAIKRVSRFLNGGNHIEYKGRDLTIPVALVDEDFFSMFTFEFLKGNKDINPLNSLTDVVISENAAKKIFGNDEPVGKSFRASAGDRMQEFTVSAVVKNIQNSSINFDVVIRIENTGNYSTEKNNWDNRSHTVYVELKEGATREQAERQIKESDQKHVPRWNKDLLKQGGRPDKAGNLFATHLLPLNEAHFSTRVNGHRAISSVQIVTILMVGLLIIFIACFNFININLANAFARSREIGVRKCLGAARWKLFAQLWIESFLMCAIPFVISLFLVNVFLHSINGIEKLSSSLMPLIWQPGFVGIVLCLLIFVSLAAGGYPSWVMIRFRVVETLKGKVSLKRKSPLRSSLIVMQFVIACVMISCTYIIYRQFQHLQNADLGINKDYVISVPLHKPDQGHELIEKLRTRLASNPQLISITGSNINLGRGSDRRTVKSSVGFEYKGRQVNTNVATVDYDYLKTLGIKLMAGRDFDRSFGADTAGNVIITESVARQLKEKDLVGKSIGDDDPKKAWHIIGIIPDFHLYSMKEEMEPLTLFLSKNAPIDYCFIKLAPGNLFSGMEAIKSEMEALEPGQDFNGSFVNDNVANWYSEEKIMSVIFSIAAIVAIVLSCLGLLAMVLLIIQQRVKEIGVRKVLGASVQNISFLISRQFLSLVLIAILIATPVSWLLMSKWLEGFPYRIKLQAWMFGLIAVIAFSLALITISINTIRAARQNPVKSLRTE